MEWMIILLVCWFAAFLVLAIITAIIGWFVLDLNKRHAALHARLITEKILYESKRG